MIRNKIYRRILRVLKKFILTLPYVDRMHSAWNNLRSLLLSRISEHSTNFDTSSKILDSHPHGSNCRLKTRKRSLKNNPEFICVICNAYAHMSIWNWTTLYSNYECLRKYSTFKILLIWRPWLWDIFTTTITLNNVQHDQGNNLTHEYKRKWSPPPEHPQ